MARRPTIPEVKFTEEEREAIVIAQAAMGAGNRAIAMRVNLTPEMLMLDYGDLITKVRKFPSHYHPVPKRIPERDNHHHPNMERPGARALMSPTLGAIQSKSVPPLNEGELLVVTTMIADGCSLGLIAQRTGIPSNVLKRDYGEAIERGEGELKYTLRQALIAKALDPFYTNPAPIIFANKAIGGLSETPRQENVDNDDAAFDMSKIKFVRATVVDNPPQATDRPEGAEVELAEDEDG